MTSAELRTAGRGNRRGLRALEAQRMIDLVALRLAPSAAAGLIAYSHMGELGEGLIVFACVLDRHAGRRALAAAAQRDAGEPRPPGAAGAARRRRRRRADRLAAGASYPFAEFQAIVLGSWLVTALGAWIKARFGDGLRARVAVIGTARVRRRLRRRARGRERAHLRRRRLDQLAGPGRVPAPALARDPRRGPRGRAARAHRPDRRAAPTPATPRAPGSRTSAPGSRTSASTCRCG